MADCASPQLLSVISLLSAEKPNLDSPANVDAAVEIRTDFPGTFHLATPVDLHLTHMQPTRRRFGDWCDGARRRPSTERPAGRALVCISTPTHTSSHISYTTLLVCSPSSVYLVFSRLMYEAMYKPSSTRAL